MKISFAALAATAVLCAASAYPSSAQSAKPSKAASPQVARGEYIVKGIAGCGDCHSPMTDKGPSMEKDKWLQGSKLFFAPVAPIPGWNDTAPKIAGLEGWDHDAVVKLLMTGMAPNGQPPRPPMPQFRMNRADAEAVVSYLKSLK